jgi:acetylornithine deacetylase/succinyl-diaminopimelate desuccinylase-like protein
MRILLRSVFPFVGVVVLVGLVGLVGLLMDGRAAAAPAPPVEVEARELLDHLVAVDTSHGQETAALQPIAERLRAAGVSVEVLESGPGRGNLIARLRGDGHKRPLLLLAHVDVVPVEGQTWSTLPFRAVEKDGRLHGRGVGDDKSMAAAFTAVMLELARDKTPLSRDVILALTAGEETGGEEGVRWLLEQKRGIADAEIALNEGGALLLSDDEKRLRAIAIGASEKTYQSFTITAHGHGGHSAMPDRAHDPVTALARALVRIGQLRFSAHVLPTVKDMLALRANAAKPEVAAALRRVVASAPRVSIDDERVLSADPSIDNLLRTTCVATMLEAASKDNVLPTSAKATVNCRILPDETREQTRATLEQAIDDPGIEVAFTGDLAVGPSSPLEGEVPTAFRRVAKKLFPNVPVVHALGAGATDSRHLRKLGIAAYGTSTFPISLPEMMSGHGAHGADERRPLAWWRDGVRWTRELVRALAQ